MKLQLLMSTGWIVFSAGREPRQLCGASLFMVFPLLLHPSSAPPPPSVFILLSLHHKAAISHLLVNFLRQQITMLFWFCLHFQYSYWDNKVVPVTPLVFPYLQGSVRYGRLLRYIAEGAHFHPRMICWVAILVYNCLPIQINAMILPLVYDQSCCPTATLLSCPRKNHK